MKIVSTEVFGPVISFITINDMNEALILSIVSGLVYRRVCFTTDEGTGMRYASLLNVGTVQVNSSPQRGPDHFPFFRR